MTHPGRGLLWALALATLLGSTGCFQGLAENQVRKTLTRLLGPAEHYDVKIQHTSDGMLLAGQVRDLSIRASRVATREGLIIQRFDVEMHGLQLDKDKKSVKSVERAVFDLDILQEDLSSLARRKVQQVRDVQVLIAPQAVTVVAPAKALNQALDFSLQGKLSVQDGERICFDPTGVGIGPLTVESGLVKLIMGHINPIADLSKLPIPVTIDALTQAPGVLNVKGRLWSAAAEPTSPGSDRPLRGSVQRLTARVNGLWQRRQSRPHPGLTARFAAQSCVLPPGFTGSGSRPSGMAKAPGRRFPARGLCGRDTRLRRSGPEPGSVPACTTA